MNATQTISETRNGFAFGGGVPFVPPIGAYSDANYRSVQTGAVQTGVAYPANAWPYAPGVDAALAAGQPITAQMLGAERQMRASYGFESSVRRENEALRAELHRLRKVEHAWRAPGSDEETRVFVVNNYQQQISQNITEIRNLQTTINELRQENANLRLQAQSSAATAARGQADLVDSLQRRVRELEQERAATQAQLFGDGRASNAFADEQRRLNRLLEDERAETQRVRDEFARTTRELTQRHEEQTRAMQAQLQQMRVELDSRARTLVELEARAANAAVLEVPDGAGIRDRERIIAHYKAKWDELQAENRQLKAMLAQEGESNIRIHMRSATNNQTVMQENGFQETVHYVEPATQCYLQEEVHHTYQQQPMYSAPQRVIQETVHYAEPANQCYVREEAYQQPQRTYNAPQQVVHRVVTQENRSVSPPREYGAPQPTGQCYSPRRVVEQYVGASQQRANPSPVSFGQRPAYVSQPVADGRAAPRVLVRN